MERFRQPVSITQCFNRQSFGHSTKNCRSKQKCLIWGESHSHKGYPNREARKLKCTNCKGATCCVIQRVSRVHKAGIWATCGLQPKISCRSSRPKHSPTAQNKSDILIHSRTANKTRSNCGHTNSPRTGMLPQFKTEHARSEI